MIYHLKPAIRRLYIQDLAHNTAYFYRMGQIPFHSVNYGHSYTIAAGLSVYEHG